MRRTWSKLVICLFLIVATLGAYSGIRSFDFITFDDYTYVAGNPNVKAGLTKQSLIWSFTKLHAGNWHPLTWLSHILDYEMFGLKPGMHHLTNLIFHIANTLLIFLVFGKMTGALWRSAFVAVLFALHPLHVESVAWIAERKDVLSTLFWMLTMWAYIRYSRGPSLARYILILVFFILGLMSKPMLVSLPFVMLLMDYWPLGRLQSRLPEKGARLKLTRLPLFRLILEKIPFFALAAVISVVAFFAQGEAVQPTEDFPPGLRIGNALVSYVIYIKKMFWPNDLSIFYPYPQTIPLWQVAGSGLLLFTLSILSLKIAQRRPYAAVGWAWYLGTLVPVIGLIQVGNQSMADRYTYIPLIGLFIIIAWGIPDLFGQWRYRKHTLAVSASLLLSVLSVCSWLQVRHWKDSIALFAHAIDVTDGNWMAHNNIGFPLVQKGRSQEAIRHFSEAVRIKPDFAEAHLNLANTLALGGRLEEAIRHFSEALKIKPDLADAHIGLGVIWARQGNLDKAVHHFIKATHINREDIMARQYLDRALKQRRRLRGSPNYYRPNLPLGKSP